MAEGAQRRLTTIVALDIAGFSRLVGLDEEGALAAQRSHRVELIEPLLKDYHGRIANTAGDSFLLEFPSAVEAVRCAIAVQHGLAARNIDIPTERRIEYRIGVNIGDVVADGDDLLGEGVNIAARLENLCEPGGIVLSDDAYRQVRDRLDVAWDDGGEHAVKNIVRPIQVWRWRGHGAAAAAPTEGMAEDSAVHTYVMPSKPSIAVLPFDNLSGDPKQDYIGDGLTETIIADLAAFPDLSIIARNSTFTFKNKAVLVQDVAKKLGARYVLEGSVQSAGNRLRIAAQLIDASDGRHIWAERYDRELDNLFQVQDDISRRVLEEIQVELTLGQQARSWRAEFADPELFRLYVEGRRHFTVATPEDHAEAEWRLKRAYDANPNSSIANFNMAWIYYQKIQLGLGDGAAENTAKARELAERSIEIKDNADGHAVLGWLALNSGDHDSVIAHADRIIELEPRSGMVVSNAGFLKLQSGQTEEAVAILRRSMRLEPYYPDWVAGALAWGLVKLDAYEEAKAIFAAHVASDTKNPFTRGSALSGLAFIAMSQGEMERGREYIRNLRRFIPGIGVKRMQSGVFLGNDKDRDFGAKLLETLRQAGLPE